MSEPPWDPTYYDYEEEYEDPAYDDYDDHDDSWEWECAFPSECLCPHWHHHSSECFTAADCREWEAEERRAARREWWGRFWQRIFWWRKPQPTADSFDVSGGVQ